MHAVPHQPGACRAGCTPAVAGDALPCTVSSWPMANDSVTAVVPVQAGRSDKDRNALQQLPTNPKDDFLPLSQQCVSDICIVAGDLQSHGISAVWAVLHSRCQAPLPYVVACPTQGIVAPQGPANGAAGAARQAAAPFQPEPHRGLGGHAASDRVPRCGQVPARRPPGHHRHEGDALKETLPSEPCVHHVPARQS